MDADERKLHLTYAGRVIDHLGLQMYQSPVAAIAELIANSWDADAGNVQISLPDEMGEDPRIVVKDDGTGMTFDECQNHYLNVGRGRRGQNPGETSPKGRPVLGRKGIGKFAGFGIARVIEVETIAEATGERTVFSMDINELRGEEYIREQGAEVQLISYAGPDEQRRNHHGTEIRLKNLLLKQKPSQQVFGRSMARRFLLHQQQEEFRVTINDEDLPDAFDLAGVEFIFPRDYTVIEKPKALLIDDGGWGTEKLSNGESIKWRLLFHRGTIDEEELRGIAVFAKRKLVQKPFLFNLTGGLGGQHGVEYLAGVIEADYLDLLAEDLIAPERQRINWEHEQSLPLLEWGQRRVKEVLRIWRDRRGEARARAIADKVAGFAGRLEKLVKHERGTVERALRKLSTIPTLSDDEFNDLGDAILTAWEQGRLRDLIAEIATADEMSEQDLLQVLLEAEVLVALSTAEAVKTKLLTVAGLKERIEQRDLEAAVRNYIAESPWLIAPEWETFRRERAVAKLVADAALKAKMTGDDWNGRVDLVLSSGDHLLILEFMRPGLRIDLDHIERFDRYIRTVRVNLSANTGGRFSRATGYIVADQLEKDSVTLNRIVAMERDLMFALDWQTLFMHAVSAWGEFLDILVARTPPDDRLRSLLDDSALTPKAGAMPAPKPSGD